MVNPVLDSSLFEGPEKKMELVVLPGGRSLRSYGPETWEGVMTHARTKALSRASNECFDAYLLSESSLFVFDERVIMITCGQTTLVDGVFHLLSFIDVDDVALFIYERKNHKFPELQPTRFVDDIARLRSAIPGRSCCFGDATGEHVCLYHSERPYRPDPRDHTLEVLLSDIADDARELFSHGPRHTLDLINAETGIREILPGFAIDEYLFEPMGYSMNAQRGREYYTIHVTPQSVGSFVSFETNHTFTTDLRETIERVVGIFRPANFDLLFFSKDEGAPLPELEGASCATAVEDTLDCGFHVQFRHYTSDCDPAELLATMRGRRTSNV